MCLIAYSPKGTMIDRSILAYAYNQNNDGIGIMSAAGIEKFMYKKALKRARRYIETRLVPSGIAYAIHFRWATHGDVKMCNTHPYITPEATHAVMHNGVLGITSGEATADESDTAVYVRKYMDSVPGFDDPQYWDMMEKHIGWGNKFCVMNDKGLFKLLNEDAGEWIDGIWFSNTYSLPAAVVPSKVTYGNTYGGAYSGNSNYYGRGNYYRPAYSTYGYTDPVTHQWINKELWSFERKCMEPNPLYKAADHINPDDVKTVVETATDGHVIERAERWDSEDRASYYESLEMGLTPQEAEYYDLGTKVAAAMRADQIEAAAEKAAEDALERTQELPAYVIDKPDADIGGDFADPADDEEQKGFRNYLAKVAQGILQ